MDLVKIGRSWQKLFTTRNVCLTGKENVYTRKYIYCHMEHFSLV